LESLFKYLGGHPKNNRLPFRQTYKNLQK